MDIYMCLFRYLHYFGSTLPESRGEKNLVTQWLFHPKHRLTRISRSWLIHDGKSPKNHQESPRNHLDSP